MLPTAAESTTSLEETAKVPAGGGLISWSNRHEMNGRASAIANITVRRRLIGSSRAARIISAKC